VSGATFSLLFLSCSNGFAGLASRCRKCLSNCAITHCRPTLAANVVAAWRQAGG